MYVILPIGRITDTLYHKTTLFTQRYGLLSPNWEICHKLVLLLTEEQIYNRLHWSETKNELEAFLSTHFDFWPESLRTVDRQTFGICQRYMQEYLDLTEEEIRMLVDDNIGSQQDYDDMWCVWHTLKIGTDLVLEKGQDWRILEFERRRRLGEW